jgi:hypothetical protein
MEFSVETRASTYRRNNLPKLSDVVFPKVGQAFSKFAVLPSNKDAIQACSMFAEGTCLFVGLTGPSGWGKTLLLEATVDRLHYNRRRNDAILCSAYDWVYGLPSSDVECPLLIDNAQEALSSARRRDALRHGLERRLRLGLPTLIAFTSPRSFREMKSTLPDIRMWRMASIEEPSTGERSKLIRDVAIKDGVLLSQKLAWTLAKNLQGDGRTLQGAINRLKLSGERWLDSAAYLRALGLLDIFFAHRASWDLREEVWGVCKSLGISDSEARSLAIFSLVEVAEVGEYEVATFFDVSQGVVYETCNDLNIRCRLNDRQRSRLKLQISRMVERLDP